jgi:hypothetical protein
MTVTEKVLGAEAHWLMGRVMPRDFLEEIGKYLHHVAPEREEALIAAIKTRAEQIADGDKDMIVDETSKGALAIGATVLAGFETLLPLFDGDERRTIIYLQHALGPALRRPYELTFEFLSERDEPLDKIEKVCSKMPALYGSGWDMEMVRPDPGLFEMKVKRCFWGEFFARHDAPLVTTVMCAWDTNWMRAIDPAVTGLRAERTSLLSLGDAECRFAVLETDDPLHGYTDALDQRFVDDQTG